MNTRGSLTELRNRVVGPALAPGDLGFDLEVSGLGVVTQMRIELVPLPTIFAGAIVFDTPHIEAVLRGWIDWTATAPADVTTSAAMIHFPPFEEVPEPIRGHHGIALRFAYPGPVAEGERLVAPLRALAPALMDTVGVPDPSLFETVLPAAADRVSAAITPWVSPETNVNFAGRFTTEEQFASAWPAETFARRATVKKHYDPLGLFTYGPAAG